MHYKQPLAILLIALFLMPAFAHATVINKSPSGFQLSIETTINAPVEQVYQQFLEVGQWWENAHTWFGDASKMSIEPKVNGCFCEINGEQEALHMTVSYVDPNKEIRMLGGLGPLQMMAIHGAMSWKFEATGDNMSKVSLAYTVVGYDQLGLDKLADVVDKVQTSQVNNLKARFDVKK